MKHYIACVEKYQWNVFRLNNVANAIPLALWRKAKVTNSFRIWKIWRDRGVIVVWLVVIGLQGSEGQVSTCSLVLHVSRAVSPHVWKAHYYREMLIRNLAGDGSISCCFSTLQWLDLNVKKLRIYKNTFAFERDSYQRAPD